MKRNGRPLGRTVFIPLMLITGAVATTTIRLDSEFRMNQAQAEMQGAPKMSKPTKIPKKQATNNEGPDLMAVKLGLTPLGWATYTAVNQGQASTGQPFVVDIYINDVRKDTIKHDPLPGFTQQRVESTLARFEGCQAGKLRLMLDAQQVVQEFDETNNEPNEQVTPPCPDLIAKITKNRMNNNLQYKAKVTVTNQGNLATPDSFIVHFDGSNPTGLGSLPFQDRSQIGPLAPGQSVSFHESKKHLATTTMEYRVIVDFYKTVDESNEDNNEARRTLGPH